ncbi:MAG TPA: hypothetical protein PK950_02930 [Candidatus Paceibacterota bacterium]|nr:hypothetical protein [Candidatus Paceibacterota bacterium]
MNIHPILVHMPIGIFTLYAIMEIVCIDKKFPSLRNGKRLLSIVGFIAGWVALATGEAAEHAFSGNDQTMHNLIEAHSTFAGAFVIVAGALALLSVLSWVLEKYPVPVTPLQKIAHKLEPLNKRWIFVILALAGLALITIVGGLGGTIVYGPDLDPATKLLYSLFAK